MSKTKTEHTTTIDEAKARGWCQTGRDLIAVAEKLLPKRLKGFDSNTPITADDLVWLRGQRAWKKVSTNDLATHMGFWLPIVSEDFDEKIYAYERAINRTPCPQDELCHIPFSVALSVPRLKKAVAKVIAAHEAFAKELKEIAKRGSETDTERARRAR